MDYDRDSRQRDGTPQDIGWEGLVFFTIIYGFAALFMFVMLDFSPWTLGIAVALFAYLAFNFWN